MPPPTFSIAAPEGGATAPAELLATGIRIAEMGIFGIAWLDRDLVVRTRFGPLIDFIATGQPVLDSVPPLVGLEDDIRALVATPGRLLELPAVALIRPDGRAPRLNFTILWLSEAECFLLLAYRASARSDIEIELTRQVRGRLMAEAELQAKSRELEIANRDLEQYAAIISHDLKAPLRGLRYLIDDLETALEARRTDAVEQTLAEIRGQAQRMSRMMSALLDYASTGRKSESVEDVDTRRLVEAIAASLPRPAGFSVVIEGSWPVIATLEAPLDLVLRNLVDNALKHHDRTDGTISMAARDAGTGLEIRISDDGPGIPPEAHETVFLPFRTLGGPAGGTGMGLALAKRTLEAVGGSIRIVPQPAGSRGTTFTITWPKCAG